MRFEKKRQGIESSDAKPHGDSALTLREEAMVIGYLLMKSEMSTADRIQGIVTFFATIRSPPLSLDSAKRLYEKYQHLFRKTQERSMTKARTDPINITNT